MCQKWQNVLHPVSADATSFQFHQFQLFLLHVYGTLLYRLVQFQQQRIRPAAVCSMKAAHTDGTKTQEYDYIFHPAFRLVKGNTF